MIVTRRMNSTVNKVMSLQDIWKSELRFYAHIYEYLRIIFLNYNFYLFYY